MNSMFKACICIDAGASKTAIRVLSGDGIVVGETRIGPASLNYNGEAIWPGIARAVAPFWGEGGDWASVLVVAGLAGTEIPGAVERVVASAPPGATVHTLSDGLAALLGALGEEKCGAVVSIGTGVVAFSKDEHGNIRRMGGWGYPLADEGGGAWIGTRALRELLHAIDIDVSRVRTAYHQALLRHLGVSAQGGEIVSWARAADVTRIAELAQIVVAHASSDQSANQILNEAAARVALLADEIVASTTGAVSLVGGLAPEIQKRLPSDVLAKTKRAAGGPLDGVEAFARELLLVETKASGRRPSGQYNSVSGRIVTSDGVVFGEVIFDQFIREIRAQTDANADATIIPGFIDIQVNGGFGFDALRDKQRGLAPIALGHLKAGTTGLLLALITSPLDDIESAIADIANYRRSTDGNVIGVHLEGPFLSPEKAGAHPLLMQVPNEHLLERLLGNDVIKVMTIAPEISGAKDAIRLAVQRGVRVQIGHTAATYDDVVAALECGATGFTHLYNAMSPLDHRRPGVVGAGLSLGDYATIIVDFQHVHPGAIKVALRCIPKVFCVSDATAALGMPDGSYKLGDVEVTKRDGVLRTDNGTLAGADIDMLTSFRHLMSLGLPVEEAVLRTSTYAAEFLGLADRGRIAIGARADLVILDKDWGLNRVYLRGEIVG